MKSHYEILGIKQDATPEQIKKAYFVMAKKYHPDAGDTTEVSKFHEVAKAYKLLSDPVTKKAYDLSLGVSAKEEKSSGSKETQQNFRDSKHDSYRDIELKEFHRNRYRTAVTRVVFTSLLLGIVGSGLSAILGGMWFLGVFAGVFMGFSYSINQNFQVKSFFKSDKTHKFFRWLSWLMFLGGLGYFGWLIAKGVFNG